MPTDAKDRWREIRGRRSTLITLKSPRALMVNVCQAFFSLTSLFHGMSLSRSMSNSLETSLTTVALSYFPWDSSLASWRTDLRKCLCAAALACAVRPTNAVLWIYLMMTLLWQLRSIGREYLAVLRDVLVVG